MREQVVKDIEKEFLAPSFKYLVKNGLENTSIRDLCKAMDISYGSLYYWFEGKDDVYTSVMKYGIAKIVGDLFEIVFVRMKTPRLFFETFLDDVDKYKHELRLIFQFAASPEYGNAIRKQSMEFKPGYARNIEELVRITGCSVEKITCIIYMLMSIVSDYVIWEDRDVSEMQMKFLYESMTDEKKKEG